MKKSLLSILALALVAVGCQNYDDQFDSLNADIAALTTKVNGLDAGVAAQVTALQSLVTNLSTQVTALGNAALTTTDLTTALAGVLTNIATVQSELTALDSSVATSIAGVNTNVAALTTQLTAVQTSALTSADIAALDEVTNLNAEMVAVQAALDELLAAQASVQGITITNQATLDYVETLVETDGTPENYIVNGDVLITASTATGYDTGYIAAISALTSKIASVIGTVTITTAATDAALDISQMTYVSGGLEIEGKMPSGFGVTTAAYLDLDVEEADITLSSLNSAAGGVLISAGTTTITNVSIASLSNGSVTTDALGGTALSLPLADVNLGAGHPAATTTVKSLIAGNATDALTGASIVTTGAATIGSKVVTNTTINAGGAVTLSSGVAGSLLTASSVFAGGDIIINSVTLGGTGTASASISSGAGSYSISFPNATTTASAFSATASGSTISMPSLHTIAGGILTLGGTGVTLSALATNTTGLTVATATGLTLASLVNGTGLVTGTAVTSFIAPSYSTATAGQILKLAAGASVSVKAVGAIANLADLTTISALTVTEQNTSLVLDTADKMVTLTYTGKAAASNAAQANDLSLAGCASLTTAAIAGSSDNVVVTGNTLMTSLSTNGFVRTLNVSGTSITSVNVGHQGLNGGAPSEITVINTKITDLSLADMKWIGGINVAGNTSLTTIAMPTATTAADNANPSVVGGNVTVTIYNNKISGAWTDAVAASGSNLYAEGSFSTAPGITNAKTWLTALGGYASVGVATVTYAITVDDAATAMGANNAVSAAINDAGGVIDTAAELALLPN